jgi:hypothetical protein
MTFCCRTAGPLRAKGDPDGFGEPLTAKRRHALVTTPIPAGDK